MWSSSAGSAYLLKCLENKPLWRGFLDYTISIFKLESALNDVAQLLGPCGVSTYSYLYE